MAAVLDKGRRNTYANVDRWEAVVLAMKAEGVPYVFGLPGDPRHLYDALIAFEPDGGSYPRGQWHFPGESGELHLTGSERVCSARFPPRRRTASMTNCLAPVSG